MSVHAYASFNQWYSEGHLSSYLRMSKSQGGILNMLEAAPSAGDMSHPAVPDIVLYQDLVGGNRVSGDMGASKIMLDNRHQVRSLSFPMAQWKHVLDEAVDGVFSFDRPEMYNGTFTSQTIRSAVRNLWALCDEEMAPSRLLARAAGCEILAELCRLNGSPLPPAKGGLAPWAERRCLEMMHAQYSEEISLDQLAAEARLSPFHFARMFKQSIGVPPRVYLTRIRLEKACELLEMTDMPITEIAFETGYSSNQALARVFLKHRRMSPTEYRRATRDPSRPRQ